ncbi:MAG: hypothetical protein J6Q19_05860 [Bacteroidaceae bacterium]|nr:hypothetical protein [Bacteroidaceae bacterium]
MIMQPVEKYLFLHLGFHLSPGSVCDGTLEYYGIEKVYYKVVSVEGELSYYGAEMLQFLNGLPVEVAWEQKLEPCKDDVAKTQFFVPPLKSGKYYILASDSPLFEDGSYISYLYTPCNRLAFLGKVFSGSNFTGVVIDNIEGNPIPDCRFTLIRIDKALYEERHRVIKEGYSNKDGILTVIGISNGDYQLNLYYDDNSYTATFTLPYQSDMPMPNIAKVLTDKNNYCPGDKIRYSAVVYASNGYNIAKLCTDYPLTVTLFDSDWKRLSVKEMETDEDGLVSGIITIPRNVSPGRYTLQISDEDDLVNTKRPIYVLTDISKSTPCASEEIVFRDDNIDTEAIQIEAEKTVYNVGDTAIIKLRNSSAPRTQFAAETRFGFYRAGTIDGESTLEIPIDKEMVGGVFIAFYSIYKRRVHRKSLTINVPFTEKKLNVNITKKRATKKSDIFELQITDYQGNPVKATIMLSVSKHTDLISTDNSWHISPWSNLVVNYVSRIKEESMYSSSYKLYNPNEVCIEQAPEIPALQYDNYCAGEIKLNEEKRRPEKKEVQQIEVEASPSPLFIRKIKTDDEGRAEFLMGVLKNPEDYIFRLSAYSAKLQTCSLQIKLSDI